MGIPIISEIQKGVSDFMSWFIGVIPKPVSQILFIFMIMFIGGLSSAIIGYFLTYRYSCDSSCMLIEDSEANKCGLNFMTGYFYKTNLSQAECFTMPQASDPAWNESVCVELVPKVIHTSLVLWFTNGINLFTNNVIETLFGNGSKDKQSLYGYLSDPSRAICSELYECISPQSRDILGINSSCTITRGLENTDDNYPTIDEFLSATRFNKTIESSDMGEGRIFATSCFEGSKGCEPEVTFFGFPFLDWRFWIFIFMFVAVINTIRLIREFD